MSRRKKQGMLGAVIAVAALVLVFQLALGMDPTTVFADDSGLTETQTVDDAAASQDDVTTSGEEAGSADASAQSLSPAQSFEVTADNNVVVKVDAPEGALPEGVELHAGVVSDTEDVANELDNAGVSYDGFVALDVYFTNADGTEVEPAQAVDVRFELPSGLVPEDAESVSVQHLAEDETGAVTDVQTVADNSDAAALSKDSSADKGTVSVNDDSTVTAEFSVDGFSSFTITWNEQNGLTIHLVDQNGNDIYSGSVDFDGLTNPYDPTDFADKFITDQWVSIEELAGTWASQTEGYTYVGAKVGNTWGGFNSASDFYWIRCNTRTYTTDPWLPWEEPETVTEFVSWSYSANKSQPTGDGQTLSTRENVIYLVYSHVDEAEQTGDLTIVDSVSTDGEFTANYVNDLNGTFYYVWEESADNGESWQPIERLKMNGDEYNLSDNGQTYSIVLDVVNDDDDEGGRWYRVSVYESESAYESGGSKLASSPAIQLDYYDELLNGSFETPSVKDLSNGMKSNYQYPVGTDGLVWRTTGSDQQVEIVNADNDINNDNNHTSDYNNTEGAVQVDGAEVNEQYAELNAEASGALYQDVITVPGTTLNWQLYHRAREDGGNAIKNNRGETVGYTPTEDTMYLLIAPADEVSEYTTQEQLNGLIEQIQRNEDSYASQGYYLYEISDDNDSWHYYSSNTQGASAYTVPEGQYLTRFFFVAGDTASGNNTQGNLLDDVRFTTELLPPQDGEANLTISKVVKGVDAEDMTNYTLDVVVSDGQDTQTVTLDDFTEASDGTFSASETVVMDIDANTTKPLTLTESPTEVDGYELISSTHSVNDGASVANGTASIVLEERDNGIVTFTNTYEKDTPTLALQITKYKNTETDGNELEGVCFALYVEGESGERTLASVADSSGVQQGDSGFATDEDGVVTFYGLEPGRTYYIEEVYAPAGYIELEGEYSVYVSPESSDGEYTATFVRSGTSSDPVAFVADGSGALTASTTIVNKSVDSIPSTGGLGNAPLYAAGALIVAGSVIALRRRQQAR